MTVPTADPAKASVLPGLDGTHPLIDARPIIRRNASNTWERVEKLRDEIYDIVDAKVRSRNLDALVIKSLQFVHPATVTFQCWTSGSDDTLTQRSSLVITINAMPFHRFDVIYSVAWNHCGTTGSVSQIHKLNDVQIGALITELLLPPKPHTLGAKNGMQEIVEENQLRQTWWEFGRLTNKVTALNTDWMQIIAKVSFIVFTASFFLYFALPAGAGIRTLVGLVMFLSAIAAAVSNFNTRFSRARGYHVKSSGKPVTEPRHLITFDSWQTVVAGVGADADDIRQHILQSLYLIGEKRYSCSVERIWYWGLEGKEEREQIVLRFGRAIAFCQIYAYGSDLYAGWDAHMNVGVWLEQKLSSGIDKATGLPVQLVSVVSGVQRANEYDKMDLNCLAEWVHSRMRTVLKQFIEERKIDQEIDFTIIRNERKDVMGATEPESKLKNRFARKS